MRCGTSSLHVQAKCRFSNQTAQNALAQRTRSYNRKCAIPNYISLFVRASGFGAAVVAWPVLDASLPAWVENLGYE